MNKVQTLVAALKQAVPTKIQTRITKLTNLEAELNKAIELNKTTPSEENQEEVDRLNELAVELSDSIAAQLEELLEEEQKLNEPPKQKVNLNEPPKPKDEKTEKKSNIGTIIFVTAVAIVTLGAVVLKNRD